MSWAVGYDENWKRDIGYGVPAICDHPDCNKKIDRGLAYVCGGEPYGGGRGCGLYFCAEHLNFKLLDPEDEDSDIVLLCERCPGNEPFDPKPDVQEWTDHKMTDPSWADWRAGQSDD